MGKIINFIVDLVIVGCLVGLLMSMSTISKAGATEKLTPKKFQNPVLQRYKLSHEKKDKKRKKRRRKRRPFIINVYNGTPLYIPRRYHSGCRRR